MLNESARHPDSGRDQDHSVLGARMPSGRRSSRIAFIPCWVLGSYSPNALSGLGHHRTRLLQTLSSAGLNIVLNLILIPSMSWRGAAIATLVTELYLVALHWRTLLRLASREDEPADAVAVAT